MKCPNCQHENPEQNTFCRECGTALLLTCSQCGGEAKRIFSPGNNHPNEDAEWIRSVREVVDKEGGPHCQAFLKDPTRTNYENWKKTEGLRHLESGEKRYRPEFDLDKHTERVFREHQRASALEIRSRG